MDNRDIHEFNEILRRHEDIIQSNSCLLFLVTEKVHENEHNCISQHGKIINLPVHQKQRINALEAKSNKLQNLGLNLRKESLPTASNYRVSDGSAQVDLQENETVHQLKEQIDIEQQNSPQSDFNQDKAHSNHAFH